MRRWKSNLRKLKGSPHGRRWRAWRRDSGKGWEYLRAVVEGLFR